MYHTRKASNPLDKVYALLGMSDDDPHAAGLEANYDAAWEEVFRKLIHFCLSHQMSVSTWNDVEVAVIEAKGCILGEVSSVEANALRNDKQWVDIAWKNTPGYFSSNGKQSSHFTFHTSAKTVQVGDVICLLQGASRPTIVRLCDGFSTIIRIAVPLTDDLLKCLTPVTIFPTDLLLVWDWDESRRKRQGGEDYERLISSREDKATRLWNFGLLPNRIERYEEAIKNLQRAVEVYRSRQGLESVDETFLGHGSSRKVDEEALKIMDSLLIENGSANIGARYKEYSQTPLSWAAEEGHEAAVRLLIDQGANMEAKDNDGQTPLSWAAEKGHEVVVRLLVDKGASVETKDNSGRTPLLWAAEKGHEVVVRLLVNKGADLEAKENDGRTSLLRAAENGHEAVVKLLLATGKVNVDLKDKGGWTPLSWAAKNGHDTIVQLLLKKGSNTGANVKQGEYPLEISRFIKEMLR